MATNKPKAPQLYSRQWQINRCDARYLKHVMEQTIKLLTPLSGQAYFYNNDDYGVVDVYHLYTCIVQVHTFPDAARSFIHLTAQSKKQIRAFERAAMQTGLLPVF